MLWIIYPYFVGNDRFGMNYIAIIKYSEKITEFSQSNPILKSYSRIYAKRKLLCNHKTDGIIVEIA